LLIRHSKYSVKNTPTAGFIQSAQDLNTTFFGRC